jgi:hypothetical protein
MTVVFALTRTVSLGTEERHAVGPRGAGFHGSQSEGRGRPWRVVG